jgi:hypothetical protein
MSGYPRKLPEFKGYTVDERLKEFRKVVHGESIEFIAFDSLQGKRLLEEMRKGEENHGILS